MGIRDRIRGVGRVAAAAAADALHDWAVDDLAKAKPRVGDFSSDEGPETAPGGSTPDSSDNSPIPTQAAMRDPQAMFYDPFAIINQMGYKDKNTNVSYGTLKAMVWKMPIVQAVIQTRLNQLAAFCRPQRDRHSMGFKIQLRDSQQSPTKQDIKWAAQASNLMLRTGITENPRGRDNLEQLVRRLGWDSYVYDQLGLEIVPNRLGQPAEWYAIDGGTLRLADTASTYLDEDDTKAIRHVQIYDGMIVSEYTQEELAFGVRNPRTDIRNRGYGFSELEMLITTITNLLWGFEYNRNAFKQGSTPKGMINFEGAMGEKALHGFRRQWYAQLSGVENAWRTPITNADKVQWIPMHQGNRDMEYNAWIDFQIKVTCAVFSIDPNEINFQYGNAGATSTLSEASNKDKITESKERGLRPMLRFLADIFNRYIIWPMNESFEFEFVGLDARTPEQMSDLNGKRVKTIMTVDEIRAEDDLPPLKDGKGEVILDPTWLQHAQGKDAPPEGEEGGPDGAAGAEGDQDLSDEELQRLLGGDKDESPDEDANEDTRKSLHHDRNIVIDLTL